jgi:hypothetical protein
MNAISKWRGSSYGRGINLASVTSHEYLTNVEWAYLALSYLIDMPIYRLLDMRLNITIESINVHEYICTQEDDFVG